MGFFDGAAQKGVCGAGFILSISALHTYHCWLGCGIGTNTRAEQMAL